MNGRIAKARRISEAISDRLGEKSAKILVSEIAEEDLADVQQVVRLADYILAKHEHKKQIRSLLAEFVKSMQECADQTEHMEDEIDTMRLNAEDAIGRIRGVQARLDARQEPNVRNSGGINLTNSSSALY